MDEPGSGRLEAIWIKRAKREQVVPRALQSTATGLDEHFRLKANGEILGLTYRR